MLPWPVNDISALRRSARMRTKEHMAIRGKPAADCYGFLLFTGLNVLPWRALFWIADPYLYSEPILGYM